MVVINAFSKTWCSYTLLYLKHRVSEIYFYFNSEWLVKIKNIVYLYLYFILTFDYKLLSRIFIDCNYYKKYYFSLFHHEGQLEKSHLLTNLHLFNLFFAFTTTLNHFSQFYYLLLAAVIFYSTQYFFMRSDRCLLSS